MGDKLRRHARQEAAVNTIRWRATGWLAAWVAAMWPLTGHADCRAASPDYTIALFELYTSEGCDTCPPADRWFSTLNLGTLAPRAAELAFHVDYWDRLGWRDRFDSPAFTQRQYGQVQRHQASFVYTPQVLLQGREFDWRNAKHPALSVAGINGRPARASIELAAEPIAPTSLAVDVHVRVPEAADRAHAVVDVALVQNGLASDVKDGENAGKHLVHDHVVRAWQSGLPVQASGELHQRVELPLPSDSGPLQVVAWAEDATTGDVLQALALGVCAQ